MTTFEAFESRIGVTFENKAYLMEAFTHRSYLNENRDVTTPHNERIEFLGDAVLELVVTDFLYKKYPETAEGELTAYRAALVNTHSIADAARMWDMNEFLLLSKGEAKDTGRAREYILANTFEAVVGAIYQDQGYDAAATFIEKSLFHKIDEIVAGKLWQDAKSRFQEAAQEHESTTPRYELLEEKGPDHDKVFVSGVYLEDTLSGKGEGRSKQDAEQSAALAALQSKGW